MKEEKIPTQKPHTSFNRRLSVVKKQRGTWQRPRKILKILFYRGEHDKGENMAKGITIIYFLFFRVTKNVIIWVKNFESRYK